MRQRKLTRHQWVTHQPPIDVKRPQPWLCVEGNFSLTHGHDANNTTADSSATVWDSIWPRWTHKPEVVLPPSIIQNLGHLPHLVTSHPPLSLSMDVVYSMCMTMVVREGLHWSAALNKVLVHANSCKPEGTHRFHTVDIVAIQQQCAAFHLWDAGVSYLQFWHNWCCNQVGLNYRLYSI